MIARGVWHQFGDRSQKLALEQLEQGVGVGVIVSPRDIKLTRVEELSSEYRERGASLLLDQQFYVSQFTNENLGTYGTNDFRNSLNTLHQISQAQLDQLSAVLEDHHRRLAATAVLAPAVLYEANSPRHFELNRKLFEAAKRAGDAIGLPTLATVALGHSTIVSPQSISDALSHATALECHGWYFIYEFTDSRIPYDRSEVLACGSAILTLATNLKPVIHAYAGPMALLSFGFGATGAAVGHNQTLWQFDRDRWSLSPAKQQGGRGEVAPRFFSSALWGTIIYPDEVVRVPQAIRSQVLTHSPHSQVIKDPPSHGIAKWPVWDSGKHLVHVIGTIAGGLAALPSARAAADAGIAHLAQARSLFTQIANVPVLLKQESQILHQPAWSGALEELLSNRSDDYDLLEFMA